MNFGQRIRDLRLSRDLTLEWVAREAGLSKTHVWQLETGKSMPSADSLEKLADVFGRTMDELWRGLSEAR